MGRYTGPACKLCRREGMKLFLKGDRCFMAKCPIERGRPIPGGTGRRRPKISDYGVQLREKQRLRRIYGLREGQFRLFFQRASAAQGVTGENLLQLLEMRLDNLVFRLGFAPSRPAARQMVRHGEIDVNGRKATIPSMIMKQGSIVSIRKGKSAIERVVPLVETAEGRGIVGWLNLDKENLSGEVQHIPTREEIGSPVNEQLIVELYSK